MKRFLIIAFTALSISACTGNTVDEGCLPDIFPDYIGVTIPADIAPMNFNLMGDYSQVYVSVSGSKGGEISCRGSHAAFRPSQWRKLAMQNMGGELYFTVLGKKDGEWHQFRPFIMKVSENLLEDYGVTYRKFAPGYETYSKIGIYQRDLHSFKETPIIEGNLIPGQCVGCHTANATDPQQFLFHVRGRHGATVMQLEGEQKWLNTKTDSTISNAVYSYWHPSGDFVAHSNNFIHQLFWTGHNQRYIEVFDDASDVIVHNVRTDQYILSPLLMTDDFETYPAFSADGKTLFYCSAPQVDVPAMADDVHYNLCSIDFDADTQTIGTKVDTLINAAAMKKSVTFPRPSFDGKWLLYTLADFGNFPINHNEADLWLMNLQDGSTKALQGANSSFDESFHNWSSNSHWILFASRRGDSLYSCIYFCAIDGNGNAGKPFLMPQKNPWEFYHKTLFTFNVPDFTKTKVQFDTKNVFHTAFSDQREYVSVKK